MLAMKYKTKVHNKKISLRAPKDEQGISLVITLLMGIILISGATGLLIRQLTAKKLSASETYQQISEAAASNGFNRILAVLNNSSTAEYRGFLFLENNEPPNWQWTADYAKEDYCSAEQIKRAVTTEQEIGTTVLPDYPDSVGDSTQWPTSSAGYILNEQTLYGAQKGSIQNQLQTSKLFKYILKRSRERNL